MTTYGAPQVNYAMPQYPPFYAVNGGVHGRDQTHRYQPARNPPPVPVNSITSPTRNSSRFNSLDTNHTLLTSPQTPRRTSNYVLSSPSSQADQGAVIKPEADQLINDFSSLSIGNDAIGLCTPSLLLLFCPANYILSQIHGRGQE